MTYIQPYCLNLVYHKYANPDYMFIFTIIVTSGLNRKEYATHDFLLTCRNQMRNPE